MNKYFWENKFNYDNIQILNDNKSNNLGDMGF